MQVIYKTGNDELASVYIAQNSDGKLLEFVESVPTPFKLIEKWVLIISTLYGCPAKCKFCDAGNFYSGKPSKEEILFQIDHLIKNRFGSNHVPSEKFKIQFSRMGEPTFNPAVLEALRDIPSKYDAPGFYPSLSTIAPSSAELFLNELIEVKNELYKEHFQFQFSIHSTDMEQRNWLIPVKTWSFDKMAKFGEKFHKGNDQKVTLNFAVASDSIIEPKVLSEYFNPDSFIIKITPVNPTFKATINNYNAKTRQKETYEPLVNEFKANGYEVIVSIGDLQENEIGSNCGQHVMNFLKNNIEFEDSYTFPLQNI